MFASFVFEKSSAEYTEKVMLIDSDNLNGELCYSEYFAAHGFQVLRYENDLQFRAECDEAIFGKGKYAVLVKENVYIPYDIRRRFNIVRVSLANLFPKLNATAIKNFPRMNYDLLCMAYKNNFSDLTDEAKTLDFIKSKVFEKANVEAYIQKCIRDLHKAASTAQNYMDWCRISNLKATIDILVTEYELPATTDDINQSFIEWVLKSFGKLSSTMSKNTPVIVSSAMEFMRDKSSKFVIIVMDGMSQFDWNILSSSFSSLVYQKTEMFSMIPTTTSVSRQCLLSNKLPIQLVSPWSQSKEKSEFIDCAMNLGYTSDQIGYERGYNADFGMSIKCGAVIINEIDDTVHSQGQGRLGMLNDVSVMAKQGKLKFLVTKLIKQGFDVYITADHGNAPCAGMGKLLKTGVEVETKSRRMLVLNDFANKQYLIDNYGMIEYPKYYLNKTNDYLICAAGTSFDSKGDEVMSHGGITVDEVIVPFITIKAVENNG